MARRVRDKKAYTMLRVEVDAKVEDIKRAFRKTSLSCHPDKHKGKMTEEFVLLNTARDYLINHREVYDEKGWQYMQHYLSTEWVVANDFANEATATTDRLEHAWVARRKAVSAERGNLQEIEDDEGEHRFYKRRYWRSKQWDIEDSLIRKNEIGEMADLEAELAKTMPNAKKINKLLIDLGAWKNSVWQRIKTSALPMLAKMMNNEECTAAEESYVTAEVKQWQRIITLNKVLEEEKKEQKRALEEQIRADEKIKEEEKIREERRRIEEQKLKAEEKIRAEEVTKAVVNMIGAKAMTEKAERTADNQENGPTNYQYTESLEGSHTNRFKTISMFQHCVQAMQCANQMLQNAKHQHQQLHQETIALQKERELMNRDKIVVKAGLARLINDRKSLKAAQAKLKKDKADIEKQKNISSKQGSRKSTEINQTYKCLQHGVRYATKKSWQRHLITHGEPQHSCKICGKLFHRADRCKRHVSSHKHHHVTSTYDRSYDL